MAQVQAGDSDHSPNALTSTGVIPGAGVASHLHLIAHRGCLQAKLENTLDGIAEIKAIAPDCPIEIDIALSGDDQLVLCHDLHLERLCAQDALITDTPYEDLASAKGQTAVPLLSEVLDQFPTQKWVLDLRDDLHPSLFPDHVVRQPLDPEHLRSRLKAALTHLAPLHHNASRLLFFCGTFDFYSWSRLQFPSSQHCLAERLTRPLVQSHDPGEWTQIAGLKPDALFLRGVDARPDNVAFFKQQGLPVYVTSSFAKRSLAHTDDTLNIAQSLGCDGVIASPFETAHLTVRAMI